VGRTTSLRRRETRLPKGLSTLLGSAGRGGGRKKDTVIDRKEELGVRAWGKTSQRQQLGRGSEFSIRKNREKDTRAEKRDQ